MQIDLLDPEFRRQATLVIDPVGHLLAATIRQQPILVPMIDQGGETGHAGTATQDLRECLWPPLDIFQPGRARADETHIAAQNVEKLRQLIDPAAAQKTPDRRDPPLLVRASRTFVILIVQHGAQLQLNKCLARRINPRRPVEYRPALRDQKNGDEQKYDGTYKRQEHQRQS